ncbi:MAG: TlpA disulfide reductase family protein, partial [Planctomycetota bacterium]
QVVIPSLKNLVGHVGQLGERFVPGFASQFEPMLQQNLPPGVYDSIASDQPIAFVFLTPQPMLNVENSFCIILPLKEGLVAENAFASLRAPAIQQFQNYAVLGTPGAVARIKAEHLQFPQVSTDLLIQISFGDEWRSLLQALETEVNSPDRTFFTDLVAGLYKATKSLTQQMTELNIKVALTSEALLCEADLHLQPGSLLHQVAQSIKPSDGFLLNSENSHMMMSINLPPEEFEMLVQGLLQFIQELNLGPEIQPLLTTYFSLIGPYYANAQMTLRMENDQGMNIVYLCKNFTIEQYLQIMEKVQKIDWKELFKFTGIEMNMKFSHDLKRNTRDFSGVPIHQHSFKIEFEGPMAELQNKMLQSMYGDNGMTFETAEVAPYLIFASANSAAELDSLIQKLKSGVSLPQAPSHLMHFEVDLIGYYASIFSMMQDQLPPQMMPIIEALKNIKSQERTSVHIAPSPGGISHSLRIPISPIVEVVQAILQMKQESSEPGFNPDKESTVEDPKIATEVTPDEDNLNSYIGKEAFDFSGEMIDGKKFSLADYRGKVVILDFWATWCPPCCQEIPGFIHLQERYGKEGLVVIGVSDEDKETLSAFVKEKKINYSIVYGCSPTIAPYSLVSGIPTTFIIDSEGIIHAVHVGFTSEEDFEKDLVPYLKNTKK